MSSDEIRQRFLTFFEKRGHNIVPSASLVPENDASVLFTTAGMQPLAPYLMGAPHPTGAKRIASAQKCLRTDDIDEVGDNTHLTFFEMLGNWSLGDYSRKEAITWSFEFLTSKDEGLGLDLARLYVTVFEGDENAPRDEEAYAMWSDIFERHGFDPLERIFFLDADANWWSAGDNGPCGPDTEMFYDVTGTLRRGLTKEAFLSADERQDVVEIWNNVFMEYEKRDGKVVGKLRQKNVDTGAGLERVSGILQEKDNFFETDLFSPVLDSIRKRASQSDIRSERVVADHARAAVFLIADGVSPSNTDQGYVLRRLLRRATRHADVLGMEEGALTHLALSIIATYKDSYAQVGGKEPQIIDAIDEEEQKFRATLAKGVREFEKIDGDISGAQAFVLFSTYGFPFELTRELAKEKGAEVDENGFREEMHKHQATSREGSAQKFKGGLADASEKTVQYHTATHLLLAGLRKELGVHVHQAGSNITGERLRFDFTHPEKVEAEILRKVEHYVNTVIAEGATMRIETMQKSDAEKDPTIEGSFWEKYPDEVTVYTLTGSDGTVYSRELCGGPHVETTVGMGTFNITKEEASSAGVRRIKAILQ